MLLLGGVHEQVVDSGCLGSIGVDGRYGPESGNFRFIVCAGRKHHSAAAIDVSWRARFALSRACNGGKHDSTTAINVPRWTGTELEREWRLP